MLYEEEWSGAHSDGHFASMWRTRLSWRIALRSELVQDQTFTPNFGHSANGYSFMWPHNGVIPVTYPRAACVLDHGLGRSR